MKSTLIILICVVAVFSGSSFAQTLEGVYTKEHIQTRRPVPYQYLREADVMWSKTVWRKIDLREKVNHPLYYPGAYLKGDLKSLIDVLLYAIDNQGLQAYDPSTQGDEFKKPITRIEIDERFGAGEKTTMVENVETGQLEERKTKIPVDPTSVKEYLVKELWFFDKQRSVMEVRIIGICPIRTFFKDEDTEETDPKRKTLFWIYFPAVRRHLANHEVFNATNDAEGKSFDDVFAKRMFSSYIVKESNTYNDRDVNLYTQGVETLLEAERIKDNIFNFEHDLWEF